VCDAAYKQMQLGTNFIRPATIELEVAEQLLSLIKGAEMAKFTKNGSDANDGALKLARAYTGRDLVAICGDHPFFSVNDWFMGSTAMNAGIPEGTRQMTVKFRYNDIASLEQLFAAHPGKIAAVFLEPEKDKPPANDFLHEVQKLCQKNGTVFILEIRASASEGSINKAGHFQSDVTGIEVEVKDTARFPNKWAFFGFGTNAQTARPTPDNAGCQACHSQNGAVDNTFVQFYPTLIPVAKAKGTFRTTP